MRINLDYGFLLLSDDVLQHTIRKIWAATNKRDGEYELIFYRGVASKAIVGYCGTNLDTDEHLEQMMVATKMDPTNWEGILDGVSSPNKALEYFVDHCDSVFNTLRTRRIGLGDVWFG